MRGFDAGKKVKGRKRHILTDTLGLLLAVDVHPADVQDRPGAVRLLAPLAGAFARLRVVFADTGDPGPLVEAACRPLSPGGCRLEAVPRAAGTTGFRPVKARWVVERTFAWLGRNRRLSKDYEYLPEVSASFVQLAMIRILLHRRAASSET